MIDAEPGEADQGSRPEPLVTMLDGLRKLVRHEPLIARSRKISVHGESCERFLLTFPRDGLLVPEDPRPLAALVGGAMPDWLLRVFLRADVLHLGLDMADPVAGCVRKLYLEFAPDKAPEPGLAFLALKAGREARLNRYDRVLDPAPIIAALALPEALGQLALRISAGSEPLLRVSEAETDRLSLDIGLVDRDPDEPTLEALRRMVAAVNPKAPPPGVWPSHVAIGRDRRGTPFVTLYGWPDGPAP